MTDKSIWDQEIPVPSSVISYLDAGLVSKLPSGTNATGIAASGASYWARTAKIDATNADGNESPFFVKVHQGERGKILVSSEFRAMSEIYKVVPEMVAEPIAWGEYAETEDTYFIVFRFHDLTGDVPSVAAFPALVADMHKRGVSPTRQFGFAHTTYGGNNPQFFPPSDTWEECFTKEMEHTFEVEEATQGPDQELDSLKRGLFEKIIPRLLRPLETEGRRLTPRLVHGDLWDGNASVDAKTGRPMIFDATVFYAHNEYEHGPWRAPRNKMGKEYIDKYTKHFEISGPTEDFDDRGALYLLRFDTLSSSLYAGNLQFRILMKENMRNLLAKYPLGYEGYKKERDMAGS